MALFVLTCIDKPNALDAAHGDPRGALRLCPRTPAGFIRLGGPFLDDDGDMAGSLIIIEAADLAAAEAFTPADPYRKAGLFERVEIRPWQATFGELP